MNAFAKVVAHPQLMGTCTGTINSTEPFEAGLVMLSDAVYPPPHGEAHVMLATQRAASPDYTTKELNISFSKGFDDGSYGLFPDFYTVRVLFVDNSAPTKPLIYEQYQGIANVKYDAQTSTFSGQISATLENRDEDTRKTIYLKVDFVALPNPPARRIPRRPSSRVGNC